jgi:hypothetical protein
MDLDLYVYSLRMMRRLIAIFCISIFLFQVIPVKELGQLLASGQMTEELQHDTAPQKQNLNEEVHKKLFIPHNYLLANGLNNQSAGNGLFAKDEALIKFDYLDVLIQPPNLS